MPTGRSPRLKLPIRVLLSLITEWPVWSIMRRTWRFLPSWIVISDPGIRLLLAELSHPRGCRLAVLEKNALLEHLDVPVLQETLDLYQIGLRQFMLRMGDEMREVPSFVSRSSPSVS